MESQPELIIVSPQTAPRLDYMANFMASALDIPVKVKQITDHHSGNDKSGSCIINYNNKPGTGGFNIFASGLLHETGVRHLEPGVINQNEQYLIFPAPSGFDLPFDLLSASFYLLSRYEEYLPFKPDTYGRFEADQSLAFRYNFLEEPVVDQWLNLFKSALRLKFGQLHFPARTFRFISTIDVDSPWAYLHKGPLRTIGGLLREALKLNFHELRHRLDVLLGRRQDPYDTYDYILQTEIRYGFQSLFFFLSGDYGRYDVNYALGTAHFKDLVTRLKSGHTIGIHPSYKSNRNASLLKSEFERFSNILEKKPEISRQHFLLLSLPVTFRQLIAAGIHADYSMGYASQPGFRAGTSLPFRFYDLVNECETSLLIHPFIFMDVTLNKYLNLDAQAALDTINRLIEKARAVNGNFTSLWHNESLSDQGVWKGWRRVFEGMVMRGSRE